ncbi:MAG: hypothetical protein IPJ65_27825 [Archangiaceae bacterium]|nr:hypothetical protein [Archangiaceae bacterium]
MVHLNPERLARLLADPRHEPELFEHLAEGCEVCEAFLATASHPLLDGATDAALLALGARAAAGAPVDEVRAEKTWRRIRGAGGKGAPRWLVALAALLLAFVAVWALRPRDDGGAGLKGGGPRLTLELQAVVRSADGAMSRVEAGQPVAPSGTLLIRYHASESGSAKLVLLRGAQREELGSVAVEAGTHDLSRDGTLLGFSLEGEHGRLGVRLEAVDSTGEVTLEVR